MSDSCFDEMNEYITAEESAYCHFIFYFIVRKDWEADKHVVGLDLTSCLIGSYWRRESADGSVTSVHADLSAPLILHMKIRCAQFLNLNPNRHVPMFVCECGRHQDISASAAASTSTIQQICQLYGCALINHETVLCQRTLSHPGLQL